jgi:hypothetical protein
MEVLRVIVDELPEDCKECKFLCQRVKGRSCFWECDAVDKWVDDIDTRPDWCPLITDNDYVEKRIDELTKRLLRGCGLITLCVT